MAEPQPSTVKEGDTTASAPGGRDDAKAAAAMSSLDQTAGGDDGSSAPKKEIDTKALGDAMARLEVASGNKAGKDAGAAKEKNGTEEQKKEVKTVKINAADVTVLVDTCDLGKTKATELLREHEGDLGRTLRAWVGVKA